MTVTAEDGNTKLAYTVTVTRTEGSPAGLPVVSIIAVASSVPEGERAEFKLSRTGPTTEELTVQITVTSSVSPVTSLMMRLRSGQSSKVGYMMVDMGSISGDVTATWSLQEGEGYSVSAEAASAQVVLEKNDAVASQTIEQ